MSAEKLRTEIRQEQIVEAALRVIDIHGMKGLSIARMAGHIGIVPSGIYRHYKNKDEVIDAVLSLIEQRLLENVNAVCNKTPDPLERLYRLLMRHIELVRENRAIPRLIFSEDVYGGSHVRKARIYGIITNYLEKVSEIISEGQETGRLRSDVPADTVSVMFLGLIQPAAILWHLSDSEFNVTKQAERAWLLFQTIIAK